MFVKCLFKMRQMVSYHLAVASLPTFSLQSSLLSERLDRSHCLLSFCSSYVHDTGVEISIFGGADARCCCGKYLLNLLLQADSII